MTFIFFILIIGLVIISHEMGHFLIAKMNGIRVEEFMVGMGPVLLKKDINNTKFTLRLLPIGGACVYSGMAGFDEEDAKEAKEDPESFLNAGVWARLATVFAGPFFNFLLGFILSMVIVSFAGADLPVVQGIMENSAALECGLEPGDEIVKINNEKIHIYRQVTIISALNKGEDLRITYKRDGQLNTVVLTPRYDEEAGRYYIGLLGSGKYIPCIGFNVLKYSTYEVEYWLNATFKSLKMLVTGGLTRNDVAGPVGIANLVDDTYNEARPYGISTVLLSMINITILLSINLGVMNLLPLPALDGGRIIFLLLEIIRRKPVPVEKEAYVHAAGMAALLLLAIVIFFNDIVNWIH